MHVIELNLRVVKDWQWCVVLLLLFLAPLNSKLAGACWLALCLLGAWSFKRGTAQRSNSEFDAAKGWVFACLSALALRAVVQLYWGDSWEERHAEFRLLFGAFGLIGLVHYARFTSDQLKWLGYGLVLTLWAGFGLMFFFGAALTPTNQIPWGASMSLLVCVVLALTFSTSSQRLSVQLFYASGVFVGVFAVFLSQARGSYGIVLWVVGVVLWQSVTSGIKLRALMSRVLVGLVAVTSLIQISPFLISIPQQRTQLAVEEFFLSMDGFKEATVNTSVGARLFLWQHAAGEVSDNLLMGVGREARMASIQSWGREANSKTIQNLGHIHNNYLEDLFTHGLFGLGSFVSFLAGLFYMVMRLRKDQPMAALGVSGIFFMHSTSSLTNVNFAHNYYPTMLSVAVAVCLLLFMKPYVSNDAALKS